ncbi:hypothetical protein CO731_01435 [Aminobacter sp. MSH1]|nr:hypothetical protein CO731_01435 [Aminobacter sp. MSH1]
MLTSGYLPRFTREKQLKMIVRFLLGDSCAASFVNNLLTHQRVLNTLYLTPSGIGVPFSREASFAINATITLPARSSSPFLPTARFAIYGLGIRCLTGADARRLCTDFLPVQKLRSASGSRMEVSKSSQSAKANPRNFSTACVKTKRQGGRQRFYLSDRSIRPKNSCRDCSLRWPWNCSVFDFFTIHS